MGSIRKARVRIVSDMAGNAGEWCLTSGNKTISCRQTKTQGARLRRGAGGSYGL